MMPPAGLPRPDEATYDALAAHLETALDRAGGAHPNPGRTDTFRRLSRIEYQNAIRDILALDVDVSALLPKDDASHGFDNVSVGELSPTLLERYLAAAQKVSRRRSAVRCRRRRATSSCCRRISRRRITSTALPLGTRGGATFRTRSRSRRVRVPAPAVARPQRERRRADRAAPDRAHARRAARRSCSR